MITVKNLHREFKVPKRDEGMLSAIKSVFNRQFVIKKAVDDISFSVKKGEIVGLLGPNGAGKSTTIKMLTGILKKSAGEVTVAGFDPFEERKQYVKNIGVLFGQKSQLWWDLPAIDSYGLSQRLYNIDEQEFLSRRDDLIKRLGVQEEVKRPVRNLSLGERMKCEFIMAFLHKPDIVFLDEPTIGLDMFAKEAIREFITYANKEFGTTIILTTHDMDDIAHLAQRVIVINNGKIGFDDTLDKLRERAGSARKVRIVTEKKLPSLKLTGISDIKRVGKYEATFTLNTQTHSLQQFIEHIGEQTAIQDLEVSRPDVEEIIKELY
jgi:ABC-2 type transport system ATP-binding protein